MSTSADAFFHIIKDVIVQGFVPTFALCTMIFYVIWSSAKEKKSVESNPSSAVEELVLNGKENLIEFVRAKKINLLILHGSNGTQSGRFAEILCDEAEKLDINPLMVEADDVDFESLHELASAKHLSLVICTQNLPKCTPPENSTLLFEWVTTADKSTFSGMHYAVFGFDEGLVNEDINAVAKVFNNKLEQLGGEKVVDIGYSTCKDADLDTSFEDKDFLQWAEDFLINFKKLLAPKEPSIEEKLQQLTVENLSVDKDVPMETDDTVDSQGEKNEKPSIMIVNANKSLSMQLNEEITKVGKRTTIITSEDIQLDESQLIERFKEQPIVFCMPTKCEQGSPAEKAQTLLSRIEEGNTNYQGFKYMVVTASEDAEDVILEKRVTQTAGNLWDQLKKTDNNLLEGWFERLISEI